ncbi:hypothetical protein GCM10012275_51770 [Longimycelium tulufanense]|uniref:Septum formation initiator n=1 Tax=Longimycelium tulufanense TaxID=907463 RepID=A0A8J3CCT0_9PSEU|nr:septum formation initiator family protein [Longimycelium tulufanense]GGM74727.1 hypothetical protein GCM10012275_51770 [Longimycelium tulufanense]
MTGRDQDRGRRRRGDGSPARRPERARRAARGVRERSAGLRAGFARRRARGAPGTAGAFGLSSTRRAALLALVVCALALSVAVPLRTYLSQRTAIEQEQRKQDQLRAEVRELERRKAQLEDPAQVEAEARRRLLFVRPGETPYVVQLPPTAEQRPPSDTDRERGQWYSELWDSVSGK